MRALLEVSARREESQLVLTVLVDGPGLPASPGATGVGLANTRARLAGLYGDGASLEIDNAEGGGMIATVRLPYQSSAAMTGIRVLVANDEPLERRGVRELPAPHPDMTVVGESRNGRDTLRALNDLEPDLLFLVAPMPEMDGFEVLRAGRGPHAGANICHRA